MNHILVTGANGFIGRNLCKELLHRGWKVKGLIRRNSKDTLPEGVEPVEIDSIDQVSNWDEILSETDVVIHLAARSHIIKERARDPLYEYRKINVLGTECLASAAVRAGARRLIFLSSIGVNGESSRGGFFSEEDRPNPDNAYSVSKWEAEEVLHRAAQNSELETVVLRPPLVYGMDSPGNFDRLMQLIRTGLPLPFANLENRRSFIYVGNLIDVIIKCVEHPGAANQTFLVSDGQDVTVTELINMLASATGKKARLFYFPSGFLKVACRLIGKSRELDKLTQTLVINSSKIRNRLGWKAPFSIEQGIRETVRSAS
ncbi:MAG: SDR family oxidoreductase [Candidatus Omnitrophica bacterium]|nr:SDR family oxidoreductase [Candidatus Omnitrophota bacterium]